MTSKDPDTQPPVPDVTLGEYLSSERAKRHVSLDDIHHRTSIHLSILQAIEEDDTDNFPAPVFVRGFIKAYAEELGLDPQYALALYKTKENTKNEILDSHDILSTETLAESPLVTRKKLLIIFFSLLLLSLLFFLFHYYRNTLFNLTGEASHSFSNRVSVQNEQPEVTTASKVITEQQPPAGIPAEPVPVIHTLAATFTEMTWVRTTIDDQPSKEGFYKAGSHFSWEAKDRIEIVFGNAGGVSLTFDGKPVDIEGTSGQVVKKIFP